MDWFELPVTSVKKATDGATTVTFSIPDNLYSKFQWSPGQHIKIKFPVDGDLVIRNYSISAPIGKSMSITVKATKNGLVSNYVNKSLSEGISLNVSLPKGKFVLVPDAKLRRSHYFFAAGSGITPIYSMIASMLEHEPDSFAYLLYGNKDGKSTIFADEIEELQQQYGDRFTVCHCHSSPGWFSSSPWRSGRIDVNAVHEFIKESPPYAQDAQYYLCGPGSFLPDVKNALNSIDVPDSRIHMESFGNSAAKTVSTQVEASLQVNLKGKTHQLTVEKGQSLLNAMLNEGIDAPYSCEGGVCGTCRCKLTKGKVQMANNLVLDENELKNGDVLACQSYALTEEVSIKYD